ncbi:MAG: tryptophan-rich sensory protein [Elusimicrobia bacterium]|nr:MAG: tryptophan-rich sensory protein [Elusimicrobiota bacterium]
MKRAVLGLLGWGALVFAAAGVGAVASARAADFYLGLVRPVWAPPAEWFGPVWTTLFVLMALAAWMVWRPKGFRGAAVALSLFVLQLFFNAAWSWLFFVKKWGALAFLDILVLWVLIAATAILFWRRRPLAGFFLLPYLGWVSFAVFLSRAVWRLNPAVLGGGV